MDKNKMFFQIPYLDGEFAAEYGVSLWHTEYALLP